MRAVEYMISTSSAPIEIKLEVTAEVERMRKNPNARETEISQYVQSALRKAELQTASRAQQGTSKAK